MEVTACEEGVRYATLAESHGGRYVSEIRLEPTGAGSRLSMSLRVDPLTLPARIMSATVGRLFMRATRTA